MKANPFNARQVVPLDAGSASANINPFAGIMNEGQIQTMRNSALDTESALMWEPISDSGAGIMFPGALNAKTEMETALRARPTVFKGPQQLEIDPSNPDLHTNRQFHPLGWVGVKGWYDPEKAKRGLFAGFQNPNFYTANIDAIATHDMQNLSHAQLAEALRKTELGDFEGEKYLNKLGALLQSGHAPAVATTANSEKVESDGGGVDSNPTGLQKLAVEYEDQFSKVKQTQRKRAANDDLVSATSHGTDGLGLIEELLRFRESQETQFKQIGEMTGGTVGFTQTRNF